MMLLSSFATLLLFLKLAVGTPLNDANDDAEKGRHPTKDATVLILGGGVAGIIAARTLHEHGVKNFKIVEARSELGGRMKSFDFGKEGKKKVIEVGANWIQGTESQDGKSVNPMLTLARKHGLKTQFNDYFGNMKMYDATGEVDFTKEFEQSIVDYEEIVVSAGARVSKRLVDANARTGYAITGAKPKSAHALASEYYQFDWEYAQTPEQTSWIASSWAANFTFDSEQGGFSDENLLSVDQRGFKHIIQSEAAEFLEPHQVLLGETVADIAYPPSGSKKNKEVEVTLKDGQVLKADYVLCTFSLGVLQNDDVRFTPALPAWKQEAIHSMTMATYTKIFFQFPKKFWFDTEIALYADTERGRYPVWQSLDHVSYFPGSGILFVTVTGDFSERIESLSDDKVQSEVLGVLKTMYPNVTIPEPEAFYFTRWFSDPLYRGSYSNWPASFFSQHHANLRANVGDRLWFAGEATSRKWFGFLHGAYDEGVKIGTQIANCVKKGGCVSMQHTLEVTNARSYDV